MVGIVLLLSFLFVSRSRLEVVTGKRLVSAEQSLRQLQGKIASGGTDLSAVAVDRRKLVDAQSEYDERKISAEFASGISEMSWAIFLLNGTLVLTAAAGAYLESNTTIKSSQVIDRRLQPAQDALSVLRLSAMEERRRMRECDTNTRSDIGKAKYLANSRPLQDWEAKANRLEGVIPLFRSENACARGLDTNNVRAFDQRRPLDLVPPGNGESFSIPDQLADLEREYADVRSQVVRAMAKAAPSEFGATL